MKLSYKWLKEFVDIDISPKDLSEALTMSGSKVEMFEKENENIKNVVVGKILQIDKHPDADKLVITKVDIGTTDPIQIVTGATNLKVGDVIPVAKDNSVLPNGTKIKKGKLRGVLSDGMLCSLSELNLTKSDFPYAIEDGIFVMEEDCELGQDIASAIGLDDISFDFEITSNRPDCFSVIGLARETAATFKKDLKLSKPTVKCVEESLDGMLSITVEDKDLCPIYSAKIIKNVRVAPSPRWMRERLRAMGVRPINNIVDITNYVMLEYGQPMHAFDHRFIEDKKIIVRRANNGEEIVTLDGTKRTLNSENLVIADGKKPIAIAGVMGGEFSGITDDTSTIVFESATFNGSSVRLTAKSQGMRTDASARYEKGLDPNACIPALERACQLVELLDAGDVLSGTVMDSNVKTEERKILFNPEWINKFVSLDLSRDEMIQILNRIDCKVDGDYVIPPSFRPDLEHKADIAEEIARFYGYNLIEASQIAGTAQGKYSSKQIYYKKLNQILLSLGLNEIITYSFISPKEYNKIMLPPDSAKRNSVTIMNPLGEDTSVMRTVSLPSILQILSRNYNNRNKSAYLFEIAKVYEFTGANELPIEKDILTGGFYGEDVDFFEVKGVVEEILNRSGIQDYEFSSECEVDDLVSYHPGRSAVIIIGGEKIGEIGEVHPTVLENYEIGVKAYSFGLEIEKLMKYKKSEPVYTPLPKYPAVTRDLAIVCDEATPVGALQKAIKQGSGKILEEICLFDVYKGEQIELGKKSVAFKIILRSAEATLTEEQINAVIKKILKQLSQVGAELRI